MELAASVITSPDIDESEWVPLQNTFSDSRLDETDGHVFTITQGAAASRLVIRFEGRIDGENAAFSENMSFEKMAALHKQITELYPNETAGINIPTLPIVPSGIWSYLRPLYVDSKLYVELGQYLTALAAKCSVHSVLMVFFADAFSSPSVYEEKWNDLNKKKYLDAQAALQKELDVLLTRRQGTQFKSMAELHDYYDSEDLAICELEKVTEKLQSFQLRPYEDLCELSQRQREEAATKANDETASAPERLEALTEERAHHETFLEAREAVYDATVEHYRGVAERLECRLLRAKEDKEHVSKAWDKRAEGRLVTIENKLNNAIVQLLRVQCQRLTDQKDHALLDMALVEEGPGMEAELEDKENQVYRVQAKLYETQLRLLEEDEHRLRLQVNYVEGSTQAAIQKKLTILPSKASKLRLKLQACREALNTPADKRSIRVGESYSAQFAVQKKEDITKRVEERKNQARIEQRQKAIQRVKEYMEKNPVVEKQLPPRYQKPSQRQDQGHRANRSRQYATPTATPTASRSSSAASITAGVYKKRVQINKHTANKPKAVESSGSSEKLATGPMDAKLQELAAVAKTLSPPPPPPSSLPLPPLPPPAPSLPPPPPPPPMVPKPVPAPILPSVSAPSKQKLASLPPSKPTTVQTIDSSAILKARQVLRQSKFGEVLRKGDVTDTMNEVMCLVRSGGGAKAHSSLTQEGANVLRKRLEHIQHVTQSSDTDSDADEWSSQGQ